MSQIASFGINLRTQTFLPTGKYHSVPIFLFAILTQGRHTGYFCQDNPRFSKASIPQPNYRQIPRRRNSDIWCSPYRTVQSSSEEFQANFHPMSRFLMPFHSEQCFSPLLIPPSAQERTNSHVTNTIFLSHCVVSNGSLTNGHGV